MSSGLRDMVLREVFAESWTPESAFEEVRKIQGMTVRDKEGRRTLRFEFKGKAYYLKHHRGIGWAEIIKCWSGLKAPVTSARNEWEAITRLEALGIPSLEPLAYGLRGHNPAQQESFLITRELTGTVSLEDYVKDWPGKRPPFKDRLALIREVARITRVMHGDGINHRDLYLCHFLLRCQRDAQWPLLHLVDLHRAQSRNQVPLRWLIKDLASIYFSSMDIGLSRRDALRFLRFYFGLPLRRLLQERRALLEQVRRRAGQLYRRDFGREPPVI